MIDANAYLGHFAFRQLRNNSARSLLGLMDRKKIDRAIVSSAASITYRNAHSGNEEIAAEVKQHRDRLIPFAVLNPAYAGWRDDLKICREEFGMRGVRLYPRWHNYHLTDQCCLEFTAAAAEADMTVSIPMRVEDRRHQSWLVDVPDLSKDEVTRLIKAVPHAKFILLNGSGYLATALGKKNNGLPPNYLIEISQMPILVNDEIQGLLQNLGEDRLAFGTGMPFNYPDVALTKMDVLDASATAKAKIAGRNTAKLIGI